MKVNDSRVDFVDSSSSYSLREDTQKIIVYFSVLPLRGLRGGGGDPPEPLGKKHSFHQKNQIDENDKRNMNPDPDLSGSNTKKYFFCVCLPLWIFQF